MDTLRDLRRRRGWSQVELAKEAGVTDETISNIERGEHEPRPTTLRKVATALGVAVEDLFPDQAAPKGTALTQLTAARLRHGMTRRQLAQRTGIPGRVIAEYESGVRLADEATTNLLASALGAFRGELFLAPEVIEAFLNDLARTPTNFRPGDPFYEEHKDPKNPAEEAHRRRLRVRIEANDTTTEQKDAG